jgi:hypothetical protein
MPDAARCLVQPEPKRRESGGSAAGPPRCWAPTAAAGRCGAVRRAGPQPSARLTRTRRHCHGGQAALSGPSKGYCGLIICPIIYLAQLDGSARQPQAVR